MRPTLIYLEQRYDYFNCLCFGGQLPKIRLRLSNARSFVGQLRYKRKRSLLMRQKIEDLTISISVRYDLAEEEVEDTLLHEMIHLYILLSGQHDTSTHGVLFRSKMREFNERFGRHITVSHHATAQMHEQDRQRRRHYICISHLKDGRRGITVAMPSAMGRLWQQIASLPEVEECQWMVSTDSYLNRFRRSRSIKIYRADMKEVSQHLADAQPLVRSDGHIFVARRKDSNFNLESEN